MVSHLDSNRFWSLLWEQSQGLARPALLEKPFSQTPFSHEALVEAFQNMSRACQGRTVLPGEIRAFAGARTGGDLQQTAVCRPPQAAASLATWPNEILDSSSACVIFNACHTWSERLAAEAAAVVQGITGTASTRDFRFSLASFVGTYDFTGFGIHIDAGYDSLQFNLGPGTKTFYLWDDETYAAVTGARTRSSQPERYLDSAERYVLNPGDVFLLPQTYWHVAAAIEPSAQVTLPVRRNTRVDQLDYLTKWTTRDIKAAWRDGAGVPGRWTEDDEQRFTSLFAENARDLAELHDSAWGFLTPPQLTQESTDLPRALAAREAVIEAVMPFVPRLVRAGEDAKIFLRGTRVRHAWVDGLEPVVAMLGAGQSVSVQQVVDACAPLVADQVVALLAALVATGGLRLRAVAERG